MFNKSAEKNIINGTEKILIKLIIAVRDIDKATSPLANFYAQKEKFIAVQGKGSIDEIFNNLCKAIDGANEA